MIRMLLRLWTLQNNLYLRLFIACASLEIKILQFHSTLFLWKKERGEGVEKPIVVKMKHLMHTREREREDSGFKESFRSLQ